MGLDAQRMPTTMTTTKPFRAVASRFTARIVLAAIAALGLMLMERGGGQKIVHATSPTISQENALVGATDWDITGAGDPDIQGFATDISVNVGQTVQFKIAAPGSSAYQINIYRLGYYGGAGARLVTTVSPSAALPQTQPACLDQMATTGLVDCGNWAVSASWAVPANAVSGIYIAKPVRADNGHASHIVFVVRDDSRIADIVFQTSDTTWEAYNQYPGVSNNPPGASLYCGGPLSNAGSSYLRSCATRAAKVSYNRPFDTRAHDPQSFLFNAEYPMVRWLEANGFDVKYQSGVDTDRRGSDLTGASKPKAFLSVGHDEYWSANQRKTVENARNVGVNLAFLSGNEMYWKTRYEQSIDGSGTPYRTLVSYKETIANAKIDPAVDPITNIPIWTGTWRDPRFANVSDGGQPENGLIGQIFTVNCCSDRIKIPQEMGGLRLWANTSVSAAPVNDFYRTQDEILGYEWDEDLDNGSRPAGLIHLSSTTLVEPEKLTDFGANVSQGTATHTITLYRHNSGALVFGAGTVQWSWGLDGQHDRGSTASAHTPDQAIVQATVNLLADMDIQPTTLQATALDSLTLQQRAIVAGTKSSDINAPTSTIVFPGPGASVPSGSRLTITGTSTDPVVNGISGRVAAVEVSVDNGATWHAAKGTSNWNYDWTPGTLGSATIKVRGIDDSGNRESAGAGVVVVVVQGDCPCTHLWKPTTVPPIPDSADGNAYELGVKFSSDTAGFITGIRYYKSVANTGTHEGSLWSSSGTRLATATFANETQSGWQEVLFTSPVAITAGTTYIASYHTNVGHYAATNDYFTTASVDSPPLHAPTTVAAGGNGVFASGSSAFPTTTYRDTNYWVDVTFSATNTDTTPPTISNLRDTTIDSSKVTISWTTDELANSKVEYSTDFTFPTAQTLSVSDAAFVTTRSLLITGLRPNTTYYYRARSTDQAGNTTTTPAPSFTVPGPTLRDTAQSDFLAGTGTGTYASQTEDGELILPPTVGTEFSGTRMPPGWTEWAWSANGYAAIGGGSLIVDGARVAMCATDQTGACVPGETQGTTPSAIYSPGHTVEFVATFTGDRAQHAGFGQTLNSATEPWAIFSTMNGGALNARSNTGSSGAGAIDTFLGSGFVGGSHLFRIEWQPNTINYYVDGKLVVSHAIAVSAPMRPIAASDFNEFGGNVTVDWVRMTPYTPLSGVFQSRIFDAEAPVDWKSIQWKTTTPAGTSVAISMRTGNTATPDATWTDWVAVASSGPLSVNSRFIQYRAALASSNSEVTPQLEDIIISTGHAPVANPDSAIVPENGSHVFQATGPTSLTANDTDADPGDVLRVTAVTPPTHGSAILNSDGSVTYTPTATYSGPDAFSYTVSDGLLTASALVSIDVRFGNIPPVANNDFYSVDEDTTLTVPAAIGVLANDTDTEHDPLTAVLTVLPLHGTLTFGSNGAFTYLGNPNYAGPDSFKYKASDGVDLSNEATVSITVNQVNDPPITENDAYTATLNQPLDVAAPGVLRNDHDVEVEDTTPLHATLVTGPSHGQLTFNADGSFSYVPASDFLGVDSFKYSAVDHFNAVGNVATVTLTTALKAADQTLTGAGQVSIGAGVVDASDPLSSSVTSPMAARVTIAQGVIGASQAPTGYTFVNRQINIGITDSTGTDITAATSNPIQLMFTIDQSLVPAGQNATTFQMFRNGILIPNCPGATTITAANLDPCVTGRQSIQGGIRLTILTTHASHWNLGLDNSTLGDAPYGTNDSYNINYGVPLVVQAPGVLSNDIARAAITAQLNTPPDVGTLTLASSGAFTFTPASGQCGPVTFKYVANDGAQSSAPATVTLTIDCLPRAVDDTLTVLEDSGVTAVTVLANDSDPDPGQTLTISSVTQGSHGTVAILAGATAVTYRPNANYFGADTFTYTITDGRGGTATGTVNVTVTPVNDAPSFTKGADQAALEDAGPQTVLNWATAISAGPANESGQALTFTVTTNNAALFSAQPAVSPSGTLTYTSAPDANGSATVSVILHDDGGTANGGVDASAAQTFTITVTAVNDPPSFVKGADQTVLEDAGAQTIAGWATAISAGPADESGQVLNFIVSNNNTALFSAQPAIAANGTLTFTPAANANGSATVTVQLHDNGGGTDTSAAQTFTITVTAVNDPPSFTKGADQVKVGNLGAQSVPNWATNISAGPADEAGQTLNFIVSNSNPAMFSVQPAIAPNGTLSYTQATNVFGSATVTVSLHDSGGTLNGGVDTSAAQTFTISIAKPATTTTVSSSSNPSVYGGAVTLTAIVAVVAPGTGVPGGPVTFLDGGAALGSSPLDATGKATYTTSSLKAGSHSITASYGENAGFLGSTSAALVQSVGQATLTVTADNKTKVYGAANPALTVSYSGFVNGDMAAGLTTQATAATTATAGSQVGSYAIVASGAGSPNYAITYVNGTLTVTQATSSTAVAASSTSFRYGAPLTLTATVSAVAPGAGTPTGSVVFYDGAAALSGPAALVNGVATFATASLPVGTHTVTAAYAGDTNFKSSTAPATPTITVLPDLTKVTTTAADFSAGTVGTTTYVSDTSGGELTLAPTFATEFPGPTLPTGWVSTVVITKGSYTFSNGAIQLQGTQITSTLPLYGVGRSLEFAATFNGGPQQSAGLLLAQFTTKQNGTAVALYATTINGVSPTETLIGSNFFGAEHRYRIDWTSASVVYWIDGVKVATHSVSFAPGIKMTIVANDFWKTNGVLTVNWMRLSPYTSSGTYTSAVFDAGFIATWMTANWTATVTTGTTAAISYRTGNTPTPDATWAAFTPVPTSGSPLNGASRYLQFQITETTTDPNQTPVVSDVTIVYR